MSFFKKLKKIGGFIILFIGVIIVIVIVLKNTFEFESKQIIAETVDLHDIPDESVLRFSKSIQFRTIHSYEDEYFDSIQFIKFCNLARFPKIEHISHFGIMEIIPDIRDKAVDITKVDLDW